MNLSNYARLMARYNRWMNEKLYDVCAQLSNEQRKADMKAPFHSTHGTLNHMLLTDRVWMGRFTSTPFAAQSLDQELYSDFEELRRERQQTDSQIESWAAMLDESSFEGTLHFTPMSRPQEMTIPMGLTIVHFFNHQTHHRGQLTTLLEQLGCDFGVTDLPMMPDAADLLTDASTQ
jgi:uncharacterized damage-inducible protein DinB